MKKLVLVISIAVFALLSGCSTTAYEHGATINKEMYKLYSDNLLAQQEAIKSCYQYSTDKSQCSMLAMASNLTGTLAGRPDQVRVAKSQGEVAESIAGKVIDGAVLVSGVKAVSGAVKELGKPIVVNPEVVRPEIVLVPTP